jgi:hypothetical protein
VVHPIPSSAWGLQWRSNRHTPWNTRGCNVRSKIRWFTEFCNSHYLSHFAAFFIDARTKRSVVESFKYYMVLRHHNTRVLGPLAGTDQLKPVVIRRARQSNKGICKQRVGGYPKGHVLSNDPSAGSPTEQLFNLHQNAPRELMMYNKPEELPSGPTISQIELFEPLYPQPLSLWTFPNGIWNA